MKEIKSDYLKSPTEALSEVNQPLKFWKFQT